MKLGDILDFKYAHNDSIIFIEGLDSKVFQVIALDGINYYIYFDYINKEIARSMVKIDDQAHKVVFLFKIIINKGKLIEVKK